MGVLGFQQRLAGMCGLSIRPAILPCPFGVRVLHQDTFLVALMFSTRLPIFVCLRQINYFFGPLGPDVWRPFCHAPFEYGQTKEYVWAYRQATHACQTPLKSEHVKPLKTLPLTHKRTHKRMHKQTHARAG